MNVTTSSSATQSLPNKGTCKIEATIKVKSNQPITTKASSVAAIAFKAAHAAINHYAQTHLSQLRVEISQPVLAKPLGFTPYTLTLTTHITVRTETNGVDDKISPFYPNEISKIKAFLTAIETEAPQAIQRDLRKVSAPNRRLIQQNATPAKIAYAVLLDKAI